MPRRLQARRIRIGFVVVAVALAATVVGIAGPAHAEDDGSCNGGELCLYWGSNYSGALVDIYSGSVCQYSHSNYNAWWFHGPGAGAGQNLNDNSMSVKNRSGSCQVRLCTDSWFRGACFRLGRNQQYADLGATFNNKLSSSYFFIN